MFVLIEPRNKLLLWYYLKECGVSERYYFLSKALGILGFTLSVIKMKFFCEFYYNNDYPTEVAESI